MKVVCTYCGNQAELVTGKAIYPHRADLYGKRFYLCVPCGAYVGCHKDTTNPLGRLANVVLRAAKVRAHAAFDPMWQGGVRRRGDAYGWLADQLGIEKKDCHIGMFDVAMCNKVVLVCQRTRQEVREAA